MNPFDECPELVELSGAETVEFMMACRMREATQHRPGSVWTERELSSAEFRDQCDATIKRLRKEALWRAAKRQAYK
jgi:hypothetical protein